MMVRGVSLLLILASFVFAQVSYKGMTIPAAHPRLYWTDAMIDSAEAWVTETSYAGDTSIGSSIDIYDVLFTAFIMQNSTAKTEIINYVTAADYLACSSTNGCDNIRRLGEALLLSYDWLYDDFTSEQRSAIVSDWNTWMDNQNNVAWGNETQPTNNYFFGKNRNNFTLGVATVEGDGTDYLDEEFDVLWPALVEFNDSTIVGGWDGDWAGTGYGMYTQESTQYGIYGLVYFAIMNTAAKNLGRNLWEETTGFKAGVLQTIYATMPTTSTGRSGWDLLAYADDETWQTGGNATSRYYADYMQAAINEFYDINIGKYAQTWMDMVNPTVGPIWASVAPDADTRAFSNLPLDYYSSGAQYFYIRNNWTSSGTAILWQLGLNRGGTGHGHHDAGTFQVFKGGSHLIRETVSYSETVAGYGGNGTALGSCGFAHNVPVVGSEAGINVFGVGGADGPGEVLRLESQDEYAFAAVDLTLTYQNLVQSPSHPERMNEFVESVVRELYYFRDLNAMIVVDRIESTHADTSTAFLSHSETNPTVTDTTITVTTNGQCVKYFALEPAEPTIRIIDESDNGASADNAQYRIEAINESPGNVVSYQIWAMDFYASGGTPIDPTIVNSNSGSPTSGTFTITLDSENSLVINKGTTSSGGTITANDVETSLTSSVETMTITDAGPVWADGGGEEPPAQSTGNGSMHPGGQGVIHPGGQGKME